MEFHSQSNAKSWKIGKIFGKNVLSAQKFLRETETTAMYWDLAHAFWALLMTIQNTEGHGKVSGPTGRLAGTVAAQTPTAGMAAAQKTKSVPVSVTPAQKKKLIRRSAYLAKDEDE